MGAKKNKNSEEVLPAYILGLNSLMPFVRVWANTLTKRNKNSLPRTADQAFAVSLHPIQALCTELNHTVSHHNTPRRWNGFQNNDY